MKRTWFLIALLVVPASCLRAQTMVPTSNPTPVPATLKEIRAILDQAVEDEEEGVDDTKPFVPHWTGQTGITYSTQNTQQGQGQIQKEASFTGTYNFTESGHYLSLGLTGGQESLEGNTSNYGEITLEGGLGLGVFLPSLQFTTQQGALALNSNTLTLTLYFQLWDPLQIGPQFAAGLQSHQGPVSQVTGTSDRIDQIDSGDLEPGVVVTFTPWDFLDLITTLQQEYDNTFDVQNTTHTTVTAVNQRDVISSLTFESDVTFWKILEVELSIQLGQENLPAGSTYSPVLGKTVYNSTATTSNFTGYTAALMYNFN